MSLPAPILKAPSGRTFAVATSLLTTGICALLVIGAWGWVRNLRLGERLPRTTGTFSENAGDPLPLASEVGAPAPSPLDRDPGLLERAYSIPPETDPPISPAAREIRSDISDPVALELVEVAIALKTDGDTAGALGKLRAADERLPDQGRILWSSPRSTT